MLPDEKALRAHRASGFCRVNKDEKALRTLRVGRYNEAKAKSRGRKRLAVQANVTTHDGIPTKATGVFKYLGTQMDNGGGTAGEVVRRTGTAKTVVQQLRRIWRDNSLPRHLKATLCGGLVSSVALYNAECWTMAEADWKAVKSFQFTTLKTVAGEEHWRAGQVAENGDESEDEEEQQRTSRMELCVRLGASGGHRNAAEGKKGSVGGGGAHGESQNGGHVLDDQKRGGKGNPMGEASPERSRRIRVDPC